MLLAFATAWFALDAVADARPEVTFIHISDQHYGGKDFDPTVLQGTIDVINKLAGTPYPDAFGGVVGTPLGVIMTGDLTDRGEPAEWQSFLHEWGLTGKEGRLNYPVYEGAGNHDGAPSTRGTGEGRGFVRRQIIERNRVRPGVVNRSANGLHYSGNAEYNRKAQQYGNPAEQSLQFLKEDLARCVGNSGRPVILAQHYGFDGFAFHPWGEKAAWWTEEHALRLWETIEGYNVIAVLSGHDGSEAIVNWHGISNYHMDDAVRFGVYRVAGDRMTIAQRNAKSGAWERTSEQSTRINSSLPPELIWGPYLIYSGDPDKMTVAWRCSSNVVVRLHWGDDHFRYEDGSVEVAPDDAGECLYRYALSGLTPDSRVNYALEINGRFAPGMFYTPPPAATGKVRFLAVGGVQPDPADRDRLHRAMYDKIYEDPACHTFLLHAGPFVADKPGRSGWDAGFFSRDSGMKHARYVQSRVPIVGAVDSLAQGAERIVPFNTGKRGSYAVDYGPVHAVVLDLAENWSPGSRAHQWLKADLEAATNTWRMLVLGGSFGESTGTRTAEVFKQLQLLCEAAGVDVCFDGFQRGFSQTAVNGVRNVALGVDDPLRRSTASSSGVPSGAPFYCVITVEGEDLNLQAFRINGSVIGSFSMKDMRGSVAAMSVRGRD